MPDSLTQLPTHRDLPQALAGATPLALLVDLDGFVWLNDQLGHVEGDRALCKVADHLRRCVESGVFRVGGDEFLVLVPMLSVTGALRLGGELVRRVRALEIPYVRTNRPEQRVLEANVVLLRLTSRLMAAPRLGDLVGRLIYEAKQKGGGPGVVVDAHDRAL